MAIRLPHEMRARLDALASEYTQAELLALGIGVAEARQAVKRAAARLAE